MKHDEDWPDAYSFLETNMEVDKGDLMGFQKGILVHHLREGYLVNLYSKTMTIRSRCHILLRSLEAVCVCFTVLCLSGHNEMVRKLCHGGSEG